VSAFDPGSDLRHDLAYRLMVNTFVTLYWRRALLEDTTAWLTAHDYQVVQLDASTWTGDHDLHRELAQALDFPDYYGQNLDALNDCLRDVVAYRYGARRDATGLFLVFTGYDAYTAHSPRSAHIVLDIIAGQARNAALVGHRIGCLVQSDDPSIRFDPVGAAPVMWNDAEWLDSRRRPEQA
jgi:hypothetical protein